MEDKYKTLIWVIALFLLTGVCLFLYSPYGLDLKEKVGLNLCSRTTMQDKNFLGIPLCKNPRNQPEYQGPVPEGYDEEHFRRTGETIKIKVSKEIKPII